MKIYCIYDRLAENYVTCFHSANDDTAKREFLNVKNSSPFARDLELRSVADLKNDFDTVLLMKGVDKVDVQ